MKQGLIFFLGLFITPNFLLAQEIWDLDRCITYALENNLSVQNSKLDSLSASIDIRSTQALRLPQFSMGIGQNFTVGTSIDPITNDFLSQSINSSSVRLSGSIQLYNGGKIHNNILLSELSLAQSEAYLLQSKNEVVYEILNVYVQSLYARATIDIYLKNTATYTLQLQYTENLYKKGLGTEQSVLDIKSRIAQNNFNIVSAKSNYEKYLLALKQLLNLDTQYPLEIVDFNLDSGSLTEPNDIAEIYAVSSKINPQLIANDIELEKQEVQRKIDKGGYYPSVSLTGSLSTGYTSSQPYNFEDQISNNYSSGLGLSINIPIFNQKQTSYKLQIRDVEINRVKNQHDQLKQDLYETIQSIHLTLDNKMEELKASNLALQAADHAYQKGVEEYPKGIISHSSLIDRERDYLTASLQNVQIKYIILYNDMLLDFYQGKYNITD